MIHRHRRDESKKSPSRLLIIFNYLIALGRRTADIAPVNLSQHLGCSDLFGMLGRPAGRAGIDPTASKRALHRPGEREMRRVRRSSSRLAASRRWWWRCGARPARFCVSECGGGASACRVQQHGRRCPFVSDYQQNRSCSHTSRSVASTMISSMISSMYFCMMYRHCRARANRLANSGGQGQRGQRVGSV